MMTLHSLGYPAQREEVARATGFREGKYSWTVAGALTPSTYVKSVRLFDCRLPAIRADRRVPSDERKAIHATGPAGEGHGCPGGRQAAAAFLARNR